MSTRQVLLSRSLRAVWAGVPGTVLLLVMPSAMLHGQSAGGAAEGCSLSKGVYTCDGAVFHKELAAAKSIAIASSSQDRTATSQLKQLVGSLGKQEVADGERPDLTVLIAPITSEGVNVGPSGAELATLRIYAERPDGTRGNLVWLETLTGQPDTPWPLVVRSLIGQFRTHLSKI